MLQLQEEMNEWTALVTRVVETHNEFRPVIMASMEEGRLHRSSRNRLEETLKHFNITVGDALLELQELTDDFSLAGRKGDGGDGKPLQAVRRRPSPRIPFEGIRTGSL